MFDLVFEGGRDTQIDRCTLYILGFSFRRVCNQPAVDDFEVILICHQPVDFIPIGFLEIDLIEGKMEDEEDETLIYDEFIKQCKLEFRKGMDRRWKLNPDLDSGWFVLTSGSERLVGLGRQITALTQRVASSLEHSRRTGTGLLD